MYTCTISSSASTICTESTLYPVLGVGVGRSFALMSCTVCKSAVLCDAEWLYLGTHWEVSVAISILLYDSESQCMDIHVHSIQVQYTYIIS